MERENRIFGQMLKEFRLKCNMTQEELAASIGNTTRAIDQFEHNEIFPDYETLVKIIEVLDADANILFCRKKDVYPVEVIRIANSFSKMNEKERAIFCHYLESIVEMLVSTKNVN